MTMLDDGMGAVADVDFAAYPDARGHFGVHGGRFVSETLMGALEDLEELYGRMKNDPEFSYLFRSNDPRRFIGESWFPTVLFNLHLTKEIGSLLRASFFANNMFQNKPLYEKKRTPGSFL